MKLLICLVILLMSTQVPVNAQEQLFATLQRRAVHIVYDTVQFKADVLDIVFSDYKQKPSLASLRVVHKPVVGDPAKLYYAVLISDTSGSIKIAKWLEQRGQNLYLIDKFSEDKRLQAYYFTCIGTEGCTPSVLSVDGELGWSCKESAVCTPDVSCRTIKSFLMH